MEIEAILPFLLAFVSLGAYELGSLVRRHVHVIKPYMDPVTMTLLLLCLAPVIYGMYDPNSFDPLNIWYLSFILTSVLCYCVSYIRDKPDLIYVNVHTIISDRYPNGAQEVEPVVYYWDRDGNQCLQEQTISGILKTVIFGIRSPLRLDVGMIRRTRALIVKKVYYPTVFTEPIDVVERNITESIQKRWIFRFKVRSYSYVPAPSCIDTTQQWLVSAYNQDSLTKELTRKESQLLESKLTSQSQFYAKSADLLVEMINDRTPGAEVYKDVMERLAPDGFDTPVKAENPVKKDEEQKKKGILRKKKEGTE